MSYTLYRCTHPPCPVLIEEVAIRIAPLAYFPAPYARKGKITHFCTAPPGAHPQSSPVGAHRDPPAGVPLSERQVRRGSGGRGWTGPTGALPRRHCMPYGPDQSGVLWLGADRLGCCDAPRASCQCPPLLLAQSLNDQCQRAGAVLPDTGTLRGDGGGAGGCLR